jgi:hypothetical protein
VLLSAVCLIAAAEEPARLEVLARVNLRTIQPGAPVATAYMGAGITVRVKRHEGEWPGGDVLTVIRGRTKLVETESGLYETAALYRFAGAYHLVVAEYTGGAHCCGQYYVFGRTAEDRTWRYLGATGAENGGPSPAWNVIVLKDGRLYLQEMDNRFDYFHACHACSLLGNMGPQYSLLTPTGLVPDDGPFRKRYLELAAEADAAVAVEANGRSKKPRAILDAPAKGIEAAFVDDLGQLLVKRTVFYLRAGEDERAWWELSADVRRFYQTVDGVELLEREITELLR